VWIYLEKYCKEKALKHGAQKRLIQLSMS